MKFLTKYSSVLILAIIFSGCSQKADNAQMESVTVMSNALVQTADVEAKNSRATGDLPQQELDEIVERKLIKTGL